MDTTVGKPDSSAAVDQPKTRVSLSTRLATAPWWLLTLALSGVLVVLLISTSETYSQIFNQIREGIWVTLFVSLTAYAIATVIGVVVGLVRSEPPDADSGFFKVFFYNLATLYLEIFRGLPILIVLLISAFVVAPRIVDLLNWIAVQLPLVDYEIRLRDFSITWRAILALGLSYGAFLSEIFRAGIQSIDRGQREAARSLGMTEFQVMRYIVLPQAVRRVLPPLGNDLIAMIKDSSLVAILAVREITQMSKLSAGQSFLYLETYFIAAAVYLSITMIGSLAVQQLERQMGQSGAH